MPRLIPLLALLLVLPAAISARPLESHFGAENSCYARTYSDQHLRSAPTQRTREIRFDHFPTTWGSYDASGNIAFDPATATLHFRISASFRDAPRTFTNGGECRPEGDLYRCQIECDGGSFFLKHRDADSILLINDTGFWIEGCGGDSRFLDPEPDDKLFRLDRLPTSACTPPE